MQRPKRGGRVSPEFPKTDPLDEVKPSQVRLKERLWQRLREIAKKEDKSLNFVVEFFLQWAVDDYDQANARKGKK